MKKNRINCLRVLALLIFFQLPLAYSIGQGLVIPNSLFDIGSGYRERSWQVAIDDNRNTIITGWTRGLPNYDFSGGNFIPVNSSFAGHFLIKYNDDNVPMWGYHTGYFETQLAITNLKTDHNNRVIIAGFYKGNNMDIDFSIPGVTLLAPAVYGKYSFYVAVYDSSGTFLYHNEIIALPESLNVFTGDRSFITDMEVDSKNNIYISGYCGDVMLPAGTTADTLREFNYFVVKYNSSCELQWLHYLPKEVKEFHNWTNFRPLLIDIDKADNLYLTLTFTDSLNLRFENEPPKYIEAAPYDFSWNPGSHESSNTDFGIIKYNNNGHYINHHHFNAPDISNQKNLCTVILENKIVMLNCFDSKLVLPDVTLTSAGFDSLYEYNIALLEMDTALNVKSFQRFYNNILSPRSGNNLLVADACGNLLLRSNIIEVNGSSFPFATNNYKVLSRDNLYFFNSGLVLKDSIVTDFYTMSDYSFAAMQYGKINLFSTFQQSHTLGNLTVYEEPSATGQTEYDAYLARLSYPGCSKPVPEIEPQFPNVFTPNGDGVNDFFEPSSDITGMHLKIYNRWGNLLFKSGDNNKGWNGNDEKGNPCPDGVYFYVADFISSGSKKTFHGTVTLIR